MTTPVCNVVYAFCGEKIVKLLDNYNITKSMKTSGKTIVLKYAPNPDGKPQLINSRMMTFNTVFLLALIMAVPDVHRKLRTKILAIGIALLIPVQMTRLVVYIFNYYCQHIRLAGDVIYPYFWRKSLYWGDLTLTRLDTMLVPVVIWAGLYYYFKWHYKFKKQVSDNSSKQNTLDKKAKKKRDRK